MNSWADWTPSFPLFDCSLCPLAWVGRSALYWCTDDISWYSWWLWEDDPMISKASCFWSKLLFHPSSVDGTGSLSTQAIKVKYILSIYIIFNASQKKLRVQFVVVQHGGRHRAQQRVQDMPAARIQWQSAPPAMQVQWHIAPCPWRMFEAMDTHEKKQRLALHQVRTVPSSYHFWGESIAKMPALWEDQKKYIR